MASGETDAISGDLMDRIRLLEAVVGAVTVCDLDWRYRYLSRGVEEMVHRPAADFLGRRVWDVAPQYVGTPVEAACVRAVEQREPVDIVWYSETQRAWFEQRIVRVDDLVVIVSREVSLRELAARRREHLLHLTESLAGADTPEAVAEFVVGVLVPDLPVQGAAVIILEDGGRSLRTLHSVGLKVDETFERVRRRVVEESAVRTGYDAAGRPQVLVALEVGRAVLGWLVLTLGDGQALTDEHLSYVRTAAASAALALARTLRSAAEHRAAVTLQRALLPEIRGRVEDLQLAARYLPGDPGVEVGGDWFDAVPAAQGAVLVVGDVQGHDIAAAALMGQLRSVVRTYAAEGFPPAGILRRAHDYLAQLSSERLVTVLLVYVHGRGGIATIACAGHPAPLMLTPAGSAWSCRELPVPIGPPLGAPDASWTESTLLLPAEVSLVLFTDGLVETRAWGGSERGMQQLCASLAALPDTASLDQVLDTSLAVIPHGLRGDDVAVLVARMTAEGEVGRTEARRSFPPLAMSVPLARSWVSGLLQGWEIGGDCQEVAGLVLTELLSNAVRHAEQPVTVHVTKEPADLLIEIFDTSHQLPISRSVTPDDPSGRGLWVVGSLSREWGVREEIDGKVVWARMAADVSSVEVRRCRSQQVR